VHRDGERRAQHAGSLRCHPPVHSKHAPDWQQRDVGTQAGHFWKGIRVPRVVEADSVHFHDIPQPISRLGMETFCDIVGRHTGHPHAAKRFCLPRRNSPVARLCAGGGEHDNSALCSQARDSLLVIVVAVGVSHQDQVGRAG